MSSAFSLSTRATPTARQGLARLACQILAGLITAICLLTSGIDEARAENLITQPGAHNQYSWELEPQLVLAVDGGRWNRGCNNNGCYGANSFGPGVRVSIPFMHNGPIDTINNNIGISFGASTTFSGNNTTTLNLPVAFQWNFYFTDIISVLGEAGLNTAFGMWRGGSDLWIEPLIQGGGRFQFGKVGVLVRVGYPLLSVGANFQF
jgi:hypothetical protein